MNEPARNALAALLGRAERAWARNATGTITLRLSEASFRAYLELASRHAKDEFHATMRSAERAGAVRIEWDRLAGDDGQIQRIVLIDADALAAYLSVRPLWVAFEHARKRLEDCADQPGVRRLLDAWRQGKRPRSIGPEQISGVVDAIEVLNFQRASNYEDTPVRHASARLFDDSKRIESLIPILDILGQEDEQVGMARLPEEVLARLGLVRYPQPTLIAGRAQIRFTNGEELDIPTPYIGVSPHSLSALKVAPEARYVLTVENYTPFNDIAKGKAGDVEGIIAYTAGMPSPAFLNVYCRLLEATPENLPVYHWGDIDLGGFRIADVLAQKARAVGRSLRLWSMNPSVPAIANQVRRKQRYLPDDAVRWIMLIADKHGWAEERAGVESVRVAYEQEMLEVACPRTNLKESN